MLEVKELIILNSLHTDDVTVRSELTYLIGANAIGTVNWELQSSSSLTKYPRLYVRDGQQTPKTTGGRIFGRVWNRT